MKIKSNFLELVKNNFQIEFLESQVTSLNNEDLTLYIFYCMNEFEKFSVSDWCKIIEAYNETGKVFKYESDFDDTYFGNLGFYIDDPDHVESTIEIISKIYLNDFINQCKRILKYKIALTEETKVDKLKAELYKFGFFELPNVKTLSEPNKQSLIELITSNEMPYGIAMFDYLGFLKHLKAKYLKIDSKLFKEISKWFEVVERTVSGNIYVLNEFSKEDRTRYTADQQKQRVQKDYEKLK